MPWRRMTVDHMGLWPGTDTSERRRRRRRTRVGRGKAAEEEGEGSKADEEGEDEAPARAASGPSPLFDAAQVVRVRRELLVACMTCPLCCKVLRDATTISECLHTFCRTCIYEKLMDEEVDCCPMCNIDLGCTPVEKLRISPMQTHQVMQLKRMLDSSANTAPSSTLELPVCTFSLVAAGVADSPVISHAVDKAAPWLNETFLREAALWALPEGQGGPTHNTTSTEPLISGFLADASWMESPAQIVEKSPSEVAHVESSLVVSKEGRIAETESVATNTQPEELESTPGNIPPSISEKEPPSTVAPECTAMSLLPDGAPEVPRSFPALGIEWPDGPQFGVMLGSPDVAAQLIKGLDLLLQIDPILTVEAMRSRLVECTKGYHAFGLPRDAWMGKLVALWDEFSHLHTIQERKQRIHMIIQQEEQQLCKLRATQLEIYTQAEAARECGRRASLRVEELQRELQKAQKECSGVQAEAETLQRRLDELQGEVILSKTRIADLRRCEPRSW